MARSHWTLEATIGFAYPAFAWPKRNCHTAATSFCTNLPGRHRDRTLPHLMPSNCPSYSGMSDPDNRYSWETWIVHKHASTLIVWCLRFRSIGHPSQGPGDLSHTAPLSGPDTN